MTFERETLVCGREHRTALPGAAFEPLLLRPTLASIARFPSWCLAIVTDPHAHQNRSWPFCRARVLGAETEEIGGTIRPQRFSARMRGVNIPVGAGVLTRLEAQRRPVRACTRVYSNAGLFESIRVLNGRCRVSRAGVDGLDDMAWLAVGTALAID